MLVFWLFNVNESYLLTMYIKLLLLARPQRTTFLYLSEKPVLLINSALWASLFNCRLVRFDNLTSWYIIPSTFRCYSFMLSSFLNFFFGHWASLYMVVLFYYRYGKLKIWWQAYGSWVTRIHTSDLPKASISSRKCEICAKILRSPPQGTLANIQVARNQCRTRSLPASCWRYTNLYLN